jgi:hypothetical protein
MLVFQSWAGGLSNDFFFPPSYTPYGDVSSSTLTIDGKTFTTSTAYSPTRKPTQITNPDKSVVQNQYSTSNPKTPLLTTFAQNPQGSEVARVTFSNLNEYNHPRIISGGNIGVLPLHFLTIPTLTFIPPSYSPFLFPSYFYYWLLIAYH